MTKFSETLLKSWTQTFDVEEVLFENRTDHQHLMIFRNKMFGRVMVLDGIIQTTEGDEFIYHESLAHTPIFAHGNVHSVLIVGGGDGGMLREVVKHPGIESITQVEIDAAVIELSREHLPNHSQGAFDDPRVTIAIDDGAHYVAETDQKFDVIISDSTDPIGPGEALFTSDFYTSCSRCLAKNGILVTQNGNAFGQMDEVTTTNKRLSGLFADHTFYAAAIPTYIGGLMYFAWASDNPAAREVSLDELASRFAATNLSTRYYTPAVHAGSFALPRFVEDAIAKS